MNQRPCIRAFFHGQISFRIKKIFRIIRSSEFVPPLTSRIRFLTCLPLLAVSLVGLTGHAQAQTLIGTSGTFTTDTVGTLGQTAVQLSAPSLTVTLDANIAGATGPAGADGGANNGTSGNRAFDSNAQTAPVLIFAPGKTFIGGDGGRGGDGAGSAGGNGGSGAAAIVNSSGTINLTIQGFVAGGNGARGGNGNGAAQGGGTGGVGATGVFNANNINVSGTIRGGNGADAGLSVGNTTNRNGGGGGSAISASVGVGSIVVTSTGLVQGGNGGARGTGGLFGGGAAGAGGSGMVFGSGVGGITVQAGGVVRGGQGAVGNVDGSAISVGAPITSLNNAGTIESGSNASIGIGNGLTNFINQSTGVIGMTTSSGDGFRGSATNFTNNGVLQTGSGDAIEIVSTRSITNLINAGRIMAASGNAIVAFGTLTNFTNTGVVDGGTGVGINVASTGGIDSTIDNIGGTITSTNVSATSGSFLFDIDMVGKTLTGGTVSNTGGGNAFYSAVAQTGAFTLQDVIVTGGIGGGANNQQYIFSGSTALNGILDLGAGANTLGLNGNFSSSAAVFRATGGTLDLSAGTGARVTLNTAQGLSNNISSLTVGTNAELTLNENFATTGAVTNNGIVFIGANKTLAMNSLNAGGAGHQWVFGVDSTGNSGQILVNGGGAVDFSTSILAVNAAVPSVVIPKGKDILIADGGAAAILGALDNTKISDNSAVLDFYLRRGGSSSVSVAGADPTQVYLDIERFGLDTLASLEQTKPVASFLENASGISDPSISVLQLSLQSAQTPAQVDDILLQVLPPSPDAIVENALAFRADTNGTIIDRIGVAGTGMGASSDSLPNRFWTETSARRLHQTARTEYAGYDVHSAGVTFGADSESLIDDSLIGAAFSFGGGTIESDINARTDASHRMFSLYADRVLDRHVRVKTIVGYGITSNDTRRNVLGINHSGRFDGHQMNISAGIERSFFLGDFTVAPGLTADYNRYRSDAYRETGPFALNVAAYTREELGLGIKTDVKFRRRLANGGLVEPSFRLSYTHDVLKDSPASRASFAGTPQAGDFVTPMPGSSAGTFAARGGVNFYSATRWQVSGSYGFERRRGYGAQQAAIRLGMRF